MIFMREILKADINEILKYFTEERGRAFLYLAHPVIDGYIFKNIDNLSFNDITDMLETHPKGCFLVKIT